MIKVALEKAIKDGPDSANTFVKNIVQQVKDNPRSTTALQLTKLAAQHQSGDISHVNEGIDEFARSSDKWLNSPPSSPACDSNGCTAPTTPGTTTENPVPGTTDSGGGGDNSGGGGGHSGND